MVRTDLSEELKSAGLELLKATDNLEMSAQGAMWVYSHLLEDWRYFLFTSLVDSIGRRKTYNLLIRAFEVGGFPETLTVEDVHLESANDEFFELVSSFIKVDTNDIVNFKDCMFNGIQFDGVIYRSLKDLPKSHEVKQIEKSFSRQVSKREIAQSG